MPAEFLGSGYGGAAAAEEIQHPIAGVGEDLQDALEQGERLPGEGSLILKGR